MRTAESVDLFTYDISKYVATSPDGGRLGRPGACHGPCRDSGGPAGQALGVTSAPFTVITDKQGYITWKFRGLVDQVFLEREVQRAAP